MPTSIGHPPVATVLAGGRGSRLGGSKPAALLGGRSLISHVVASALAAELRTVVVAKAGTPLPSLDVDLLLEPPQPRHPLVGVVTALRQTPAILAIPCDMPFLTAALLRGLASTGGETAVTTIDGVIQPFPALYTASALPVLEAALAAEASLRATLAQLEPLALPLDRFGDPARLAFTVNTPADLAHAERMLDGC